MMYLSPLLSALNYSEISLQRLYWALFKFQCLTLSFPPYFRKTVNSLNTRYKNGDFLIVSPCWFLCCKVSIIGWTKGGPLEKGCWVFQSSSFSKLLMICYAFVLRIVYHIPFPVYRTRAVCRKTSCKLVEPFFHLHASSVRDTCLSGFTGNGLLLIWTNILSN